MAKRIPKNKMTQKDVEDWDKLYFYVKDNVLGYDEKQKLSRPQVLRLKGLLNGKYIANNNIEDMSDYSYETILLTFKYSMPDIRKALSTVRFTDETHKFNYILRIVESNINTVYLKMKNLDKAKAEAKKASIDVHLYNGAQYKPKKKKENKFSDLW